MVGQIFKKSLKSEKSAKSKIIIFTVPRKIGKLEEGKVIFKRKRGAQRP